MKINKLFIFAAAMLTLAGCNDEWNEDKLDGFGNFEVTDVKKLEYTLTDADYKTIANNSSNKSIALAADPVDSVYYKALTKLTNNKYFTEETKAADYIPAFLAANYPTADNTSAIKVTYNKLVGEPEYLKALNKGNVYELTKDDYTSVWEAKGIEASYLTPQTLSKIPAILKNAKPDAEEGDVLLLNFSYSQTEPSISGGVTEVEVPGEWTEVAIPNMAPGNNWNFVNSGDIDLSAYAGKNIQFAFRYMSDGTNTATSTYEVKNVSVKANGTSIFEETFESSLGEFTTEGELPDGLSYVWSYAKGYGAKASAYANGTRYVTDIYLVSPTINITAGAVLNFDHALNYLKIENKSDYIKVMVREILKMSKEEANSPYYAKATTIVENGKYIIASNVDGVYKAATPLSGNYGYLNPTDLEGTRVIATDEVNALAFTLTKTDAGYSIKDEVNGKYYYQSGTYNSFNVKNAYAADNGKDCYDWTFEAQADGTFKITNVLKEKYIQYDTQYNSYGSYNTQKGIMPCLLKYNAAPVASRSSLPTIGYNASAVFVFNGSAWKEVTEEGINVQAVDPSIYNTLGSEFISNPASVLPEYMKGHNPYAQEGDVVAIVYQNASSQVEAKELVYTNEEWIITTNTTTATDQFVKANNTWKYDPSVTIDIPEKSDASKLYFQAAVDYVWEKYDVPNGCTNKGQGYVSSYGNNDYYSGASAYYGNVDWRASAAKAQYPAEYESMTDDEIVAKMQERYIECMKAALEAIHPDAVPVEGVDVTYTINYVVYTGARTNWTIQYKVTAPGTFEYVTDSMKPVE